MLEQNEHGKCISVFLSFLWLLTLTGSLGICWTVPVRVSFFVHTVLQNQGQETLLLTPTGSDSCQT